jgi:hypothetical protein
MTTGRRPKRPGPRAQLEFCSKEMVVHCRVFMGACQMPKNFVVRCDDPANEFARDHTNVVRPFNALEHEEATKVTYHHPGLGTTEPEGAQFLVWTLSAVGGFILSILLLDTKTVEKIPGTNMEGKYAIANVTTNGGARDRSGAAYDDRDQ